MPQITVAADEKLPATHSSDQKIQFNVNFPRQKKKTQILYRHMGKSENTF